MSKNPGLKEYAISALLTAAVLCGLFFAKIYLFPPEEPFAPPLVIYGKLIVPSIALGIAVCIAFLLLRKPDFLFIVAATAIFASLLCDGARYTALYAFAALCFLGSIPFVASLLTGFRHIASEDAA